MHKSIKLALEEQQWSLIDDLEVYFFWNESKLKNSGQIHIKSAKHTIGFCNGEIVDFLVDTKHGNLLIINDSQLKPPARKNAIADDIWRSLNKEYPNIEDFGVRHRPLFNLLKIKKTTVLPGKKVRACDYLPNIKEHRFAISVDLRKIMTW